MNNENITHKAVMSYKLGIQYILCKPTLNDAKKIKDTKSWVYWNGVTCEECLKLGKRFGLSSVPPDTRKTIGED